MSGPIHVRHRRRDAHCVWTHPLCHKDPFDEMLLVQAPAEGMRLLTPDMKLVSHPLAMPLGFQQDDVDE